MKEKIRVANTQAFWGDRTGATAWTLSLDPAIDYVTLDFLAEVSMGIMAAQREKDPSGGYAKDFVEVIASLIPYWKGGGACKVITNAGGLNPIGCAAACKKVLEAAGIKKTIGVVEGDNAIRLIDLFEDLFSIRNKIVTANVYLGAEPIVKSLSEGADIVITGRTADPSLTVAPCIYEFGWESDDYHKIAQATVAGHLIECGTQVTGGISTNWLEIDRYLDIGYPIAEISSSGDVVITKPEGTGGHVTEQTVKEQLLYEIADPARYLSPDAIVSFQQIEIADFGNNHVGVSGAKGSAPLETYKVGVTYRDGFRAEGSLVITGPMADVKASRVSQVILSKVKPERSEVEYFGTEEKGILRIAVADQDRSVVERWTKEIAPLVTAGPQGVTGYTTGRPKTRPIFSFASAQISRHLIHPATLCFDLVKG